MKDEDILDEETVPIQFSLTEVEEALDDLIGVTDDVDSHGSEVSGYAIDSGYAAPLPAADALAAPAAVAPDSRGRGSRRRRSRGGIVVNTSAVTGKSAKDLYSAVAQQLGWKEVDIQARPSTTGGPAKAPSSPTIFCVMQTQDTLERLPLRKRSWVTRFLGLPELCDKGNMARMIMHCKDFVAEDTFSYNPRTWILPDQLEDLRSVLSKSSKTVIVKPEDGSQGDGIFLVQGARDLDVKMSTNANKSGVAQRYLDKPLLHKGFKFDFRVYVALIGGSSEDPPRTFLCKEGLARFCTEPYQDPDQKNMHKCMGHLTNYSLNKRSELFEHSGETMEAVYSIETTSSKRPLTVALRQLAIEHPNFTPEEFYLSLESLIRTTVALMAPVLANQGRDAHSAGGEMRSCQVLGFDVMLDRQFAPYLLEVNNSPSLCIDEALPLNPDEAAQFVQKGGRGGGRAGMKTKDGDNVCRCMDMAQVHRHQTALVDLAVKKTVVVGLFQILEQMNSESEDIYHDDYIEVEVKGDDLHELLKSVEQRFSQAGGAAKAFTSAALRRMLGSLCGATGGTGSLQKHDLDSMAKNMRATRFTSHDPHSKVEALRMYDYLDALRQVATRAFPGAAPREALEQILTMAGPSS